MLESDNVAVNSLRMDNIELSNINLLVGRNASGKTTVADALIDIADVLKGNIIRLGQYHIEFETLEKTILKYTFNVTIGKSKIEIAEDLIEGDKKLLSRINSEATIWSVKDNDYISINPPMNKLVHQIRRDEINHPFLETLIKWANNVHSFKFGHIHPSSFIKPNFTKENLYNPDTLTSINEKDLNKLIGELSASTKQTIISEFNSLGYDLELLNVQLVNDQNIIYIKENNIKYEIRQSDISQGMFRSLFLLIFIHHLIEKDHAKTIIIDDLCEGLDYQRATKLGRLLFAKMGENCIQFIATSNDYFLMNVVDVKYWNIIYRVKDKIKVQNYSNSQEKFDEFRMSGLNNFDLYSSSFLDYK